MTWQFDPTHTRIEFAAKHMLVAKVRGAFESYDLEAEIDETDLSKSSATISIDVASVNSGVADRDAHLRSADFFEVDTYPTLTFTSTAIRPLGADAYDVVGDLTIHGVTKPVTLAASFLGTAKDPWGNEKFVFEAEVTLNRKDFGLHWNAALETGGFLVGDEVKVTLEIQAK
jgi:polyisoprenoid-binding protein YceI